MKKKIFEISFSIAIFFMMAFIGCSLLISHHVEIPSFIDIRWVGTAFIYPWVLSFVVAVVAGSIHLIKDDTPYQLEYYKGK